MILEFSEKLKKLRHARGLTQAELAGAIFVSRSSVAKWENGLGLPGADSLSALAAFFGVSEDFFSTEMPEEVIVSKNQLIRKRRYAAWIPLAVLLMLAFLSCVLLICGFRLTSGGCVDPYYHKYPTIWEADYNFYLNDREAPGAVIAVGKYGPLFRQAEGEYLDIINPAGDKIGILLRFTGANALYCFVFTNGYITEMGHTEDGAAYAKVDYPYRTKEILLDGAYVELDFYCYFKCAPPLGEITIKGEKMRLVPQDASDN